MLETSTSSIILWMQSIHGRRYKPGKGMVLIHDYPKSTHFFHWSDPQLRAVAFLPDLCAYPEICPKSSLPLTYLPCSKGWGRGKTSYWLQSKYNIQWSHSRTNPMEHQGNISLDFFLSLFLIMSISHSQPEAWFNFSWFFWAKTPLKAHTQIVVGRRERGMNPYMT